MAMLATSGLVALNLVSIASVRPLDGASVPDAISAVARKPASHETRECRLPSNRMRKLPWTCRTVRTVIREIAGSLVRAQRAVQRSDRLSALILAAYSTHTETVPSRQHTRARRVLAGGADEMSEGDG